MSLRKLAGPFNLVDGNGTAMIPHTINPICYYPGFGLVMKLNWPSYGNDAMSLVTYDGVAALITTQDIGGAGGFMGIGFLCLSESRSSYHGSGPGTR